MIVEPLTVGPIVGYTTDTTCRLWGRGPDDGRGGQRVFAVARAFRAGTRVAIAHRQFKMMAKFDYTGVGDLIATRRRTPRTTTRSASCAGTRPGTRFRESEPLDWSGASSGRFRTCAPPGAPVPCLSSSGRAVTSS